jgi:hypothetical protein
MLTRPEHYWCDGKALPSLHSFWDRPHSSQRLVFCVAYKNVSALSSRSSWGAEKPNHTSKHFAFR